MVVHLAPGALCLIRRGDRTRDLRLRGLGDLPDALLRRGIDDAQPRAALGARELTADPVVSAQA